MNILLLSAGGGGGNILRSLKGLFHRDLAITQKADPHYAKRLRSVVTTRFLDTNEFSLSDVPAAERLLIGPRTTGRLGARHSPDVALEALEESRDEVEALIQRHSVVILIGTGGKGTGAGTIFPLARMARDQKKLVLPIFVRPSFERHEVDKRRYDHALRVVGQFDAARIRLMEILNDRGYTAEDPQAQSVIWERMNQPIARGLRGLIHVLWDLSQVDPSDLSMLFAGDGRFRIAFAEIDPPAGQDPADPDVDRAAQQCCENPYYAFGKPAGTSLVCIQGDWSNLVDAKIKGQLAAAALGERSEGPYNPLYVRASSAPRPWGVTALFSEYTGVHAPLEIDWSLDDHRPQSTPSLSVKDQMVVVRRPPASVPLPVVPAAVEKPPRTFTNLWEFAVAVNRSDSAALALAGDGAASDISIEAADVKKLLTTLWFRAVVPRLSEAWRERILDVLVDSVAIPNHRVKVRGQLESLCGLNYSELQELARTSVPDHVRGDFDLLLTVARLWGDGALKRFRFTDVPPSSAATKLASLFQGLRHGEAVSPGDRQP